MGTPFPVSRVRNGRGLSHLSFAFSRLRYQPISTGTSAKINGCAKNALIASENSEYDIAATASWERCEDRFAQGRSPGSRITASIPAFPKLAL